MTPKRYLLRRVLPHPNMISGSLYRDAIKMYKLPTDISIITTYRCPMRCMMCNIWKNPTEPEKEIKPSELEMLPDFKFVNITGGEPFVREDLEDIIEVMFRKSPRIVISTSGWMDERVIALARKYPRIGIRISIEGMRDKNDELRGRSGGFDKGIGILRELKDMGLKDIGFGITVSNHNSADMLELYRLSKELGMEFATAAFHNSFYFHKYDNVITNAREVTDNFLRLIEAQLKEPSPKSWFRAYFNMGLINYVNGGKRLLPCEAGSVNCFLDPYGEIYPCNGMEENKWKLSMGNIRSGKSFEEIWNSPEAEEVRRNVAECQKNCWMVGTVSPVMKKKIIHPAAWVADNKFRSLVGLKPILNARTRESINNNANCPK